MVYSYHRPKDTTIRLVSVNQKDNRTLETESLPIRYKEPFDSTAPRQCRDKNRR